MPTVTTYSHARANLAELCDEVASTREAVIIRRRNRDDVALIAANELDSVIETAHLMRSPKNAERLLKALTRAKKHELPDSSISELKGKLDREPGQR